MTKKLLLIVVAVLVAPLTTFAQRLPETSTAENPVWYHIQVKGEDSRVGLVFTAEGTSTVSGRKLVNTTNQSEISPQLWRFEDLGEGWYSIISKSTGKKLDVIYSAADDCTMTTLSDSPTAKFKMPVLNDGFGMEILTAPTGGSPSEIYLHQGNSGWDYAIILVGTNYSSSANSQFSFTLYQDFSIEYSTPNNEVWYNVVSAKSGLSNKVMMENTSATDAQYAILVEEMVSGNKAQQWKVVKKDGSDNVFLVNRASGNVVRTKSTADELFNVTQTGSADADNGGWSLTYQGAGQYTISGKEEDGVTRYLNVSTQGTEPDVFDDKKAKDSGFAWMFKKVEEPPVGVTETPADKVKVYVRSRRIVVPGTNDYTVKNVSGIIMNKSAQLSAGVYLVTVEGRTIKVSVK